MVNPNIQSYSSNHRTNSQGIFQTGLAPTFNPALTTEQLKMAQTQIQFCHSSNEKVQIEPQLSPFSLIEALEKENRDLKSENNMLYQFDAQLTDQNNAMQNELNNQNQVIFELKALIEKQTGNIKLLSNLINKLGNEKAALMQEVKKLKGQLQERDSSAKLINALKEQIIKLQEENKEYLGMNLTYEKMVAAMLIQSNPNLNAQFGSYLIQEPNEYPTSLPSNLDGGDPAS